MWQTSVLRIEEPAASLAAQTSKGTSFTHEARQVYAAPCGLDLLRSEPSSLESTMASLAFTQFLIPLLQDASELEKAHSRLRTGNRGRQWGLGALNRAAVVMCLSAWEAYVEEIAKEAVNALRPATPGGTSWPALLADIRAQAGRFNAPNVENVRRLFADSIGLPDVTVSWQWRNCTSQQACQRLSDAIRLRHQVAHGVNPRPTVHNQYASSLPGFFRQLGTCTDAALRTYLSRTLQIPHPWP